MWFSLTNDPSIGGPKLRLWAKLRDAAKQNGAACMGLQPFRFSAQFIDALEKALPEFSDYQDSDHVTFRGEFTHSSITWDDPRGLFMQIHCQWDGAWNVTVRGPRHTKEGGYQGKLTLDELMTVLSRHLHEVRDPKTMEILYGPDYRESV